MEAIGKKVIALHRSSIEFLKVNNLKLGDYRYLKDFEIEKLKQLIK